MEQDNKDTVTIAGVNFSTDKAFAEYRAKHEFKVGDAVMGLFAGYDTKVKPAFITGINDFGDGRRTIDIAYIEFNEFKFDSIMDDACYKEGKRPDSGLIGLAPVNRWNDIGLKCANVLEALKGTIAAKELELDKLRKQTAMVEEFMKGIEDRAAGGGDAK